MRLVGKKLYRVGPLKCFKGGSGGGSTGGSSGGSPQAGTVSDPVYGTTVQVSDVGTALATGAVGGTNSAGAKSRQGRIGSTYEARTETVYDPVYGTEISLTPAEAEIAKKTGAIGPGGDSVSASGKQQRIASNYLDQFKTEAQREEEARKKADLEKQVDEINEEFNKAKDTRSFLEKIGDVLYTGELAAFSDALTAKIEKRRYQETRRNQGIEEARRQNRIVVIDGMVYKPGMSTTGEQQRLSDASEKFGFNEEYIRDLGYVDLNMSDAELQDAIDQNENMAARLGLTGEELAAKPEFRNPTTGKMTKFGEPGYNEAKNAYNSKLQQKYEKNVRDMQKLMQLSNLNQLTPEQQQKFNKLKGMKGIGEIAEAVEMGLDIGQAVADYFATPTGFTEAAEAMAQEQERIQGGVNEQPQRVEDVTDPEVKKEIETFERPESGKPGTLVKGPTKPGGTPIESPAPAPKLSLQQQLERRARGEDLIAEREGKLARERGLAQQLAMIRGARGATAGQRLRALRRSGEQLTTQLGAATAIEKAKEQQRAQDMLIDLQEREKDRAAKVPTISAAPAAPQRSGLSKILDQAKAIKQGYDIGKELYEDFTKKKDKKKKKAEGGFVSGPGTETSDSIPARLSDGEFVVKASAVRGLGKAMGAKDKKEERAKGVDFLYKLQDRMDKVEKFGGGGPVEKEEPEVEKGEFVPSKKYGKLDEDKKRKLLRERQKMLQMAKKMGIKVEMKKYKDGGEIEPDFDRFLKFMDKGVSHSLMKKRIQKAKISKKEKEKLLKGLGEEPKFAEGGEAYSRPKKAFKEAIGYEPESRFHDKALKDTKFGGARRKFRHFQDGGLVDIKKPDMVKDQFKMPTSGYGSVVAAQGDLMRRIEELERKMGK